VILDCLCFICTGITKSRAVGLTFLFPTCIQIDRALVVHSVAKSKQLVDELNSDLRRQLQHAKAKTVLDKQTYDSTVNKYETMWETYKSVYLQFPLAAERHALTNKNKRDEIAIAQCRQDVLDMKEKITTMKKIKGKSKPRR
jgi:UDP-3-O-[3-hydroxymyristoyl] glucosamine N-acyltransferase